MLFFDLFTAHIWAFWTKILSYMGRKWTCCFLLCLPPIYEHFELKCYHIWAGNESVFFGKTVKKRHPKPPFFYKKKCCFAHIRSKIKKHVFKTDSLCKKTKVFISGQNQNLLKTNTKWDIYFILYIWNAGKKSYINQSHLLPSPFFPTETKYVPPNGTQGSHNWKKFNLFFYFFEKLSVCAPCVHIPCLTIRFLAVQIWYLNVTKYQKRVPLQNSKKKSCFLPFFGILSQKYGYFRNFKNHVMTRLDIPSWSRAMKLLKTFLDSPRVIWNTNNRFETSKAVPGVRKYFWRLKSIIFEMSASEYFFLTMIHPMYLKI